MKTAVGRRKGTSTASARSGFAALAAAALSKLISPNITFLVWERLFWLMGRRRHPSASPPSIKSVLVVRNDGIGDVVLTTPLLRALRHTFPEAWISLVVRPAVKDLVDLCPYIDEVLIFDRNPADKSDFRFPRRFWKALSLAARCLWKRNFDLAIVPRWEVDHYYSSYISYLSGAPRRIGYSESVTEHKLRFNRGYDRLFTDVLQERQLKHELEHDLDIIEYLGGRAQTNQPEVWFTSEDMLHAKDLLHTSGWNPALPLIAVGIGASSPARRWPAERYAAVASWLSHTCQAQILLVGGPADTTLSHEFTASHTANVINSVGQVTLPQAAALLSQCNFYLGNNTGPMHMSAALALPIVELSCNASTCSPIHNHSSQRFGPWGVPHCLVQPDHSVDACVEGCSQPVAHCILAVSVDQVKNALARRLPNWCTSRAPREPTLVV